MLDKKIVLITGTNSGFGYLATLHLAKDGFFVIATMRDISKKNELLSDAKTMDITSNMDIMQLDVTNQQQIEDLMQYVSSKYGKIDILINNAGFCLGGITELIDIDSWKEQFEPNLFGVVALTQAVLPFMRERRSGKIINIGSISGRFAFPGLGPYAASKFALEGFSESLRLEMLPFGVSVSIIEAGSFKTNIWAKALNQKMTAEHNDYKPLVNVIYQEAKKSAQHAADPMEVIRTILQICKTDQPKLRYQVGKGVRTLILLKSLLPWSFIEWIMKRRLR